MSALVRLAVAAGILALAVTSVVATVRERRRRAAWNRGAPARHYRKQLVNAADWAITSARRRASYDELARVTVADVQQRAADDFGLAVPHDHAAAVLLERMRHRNGDFDMVTDAQPPTTGREMES